METNQAAIRILTVDHGASTASARRLRQKHSKLEASQGYRVSCLYLKNKC